MRQLQKGDQGPRQRDHRRIRLASVLILRTLRKANHRVPEETQASSAQDDRIAAIGVLTQQWTTTAGLLFSAPFSHGRRHSTRSSSPNFKSPPFSAGKCFVSASGAPPYRTRNPAHFRCVRGESASLTIHRIWQEQLHWIMVFGGKQFVCRGQSSSYYAACPLNG
jgi:hypothetical protein